MKMRKRENERRIGKNKKQSITPKQGAAIDVDLHLQASAKQEIKMEESE